MFPTPPQSGQNRHFQHWYAYISEMADPNHPIFARIGLLYLLQIYQWVSTSIKDHWGMDAEKWKWMYSAFWNLFLDQPQDWAVSLPVCPYLNIGWVKSLHFCQDRLFRFIRNLSIGFPQHKRPFRDGCRKMKVDVLRFFGSIFRTGTRSKNR